MVKFTKGIEWMLEDGRRGRGWGGLENLRASWGVDSRTFEWDICFGTRIHAKQKLTLLDENLKYDSNVYWCIFLLDICVKLWKLSSFLGFSRIFWIFSISSCCLAVGWGIRISTCHAMLRRQNIFFW